MKIGIMGGTFDPIHIGHLLLGEFAYEDFGLDEIWFLPNGNPPHKDTVETKKALRHRVNMVQLSIADVPYFRLNLYEAEVDHHSYTYQTMREFNRLYPNDSFYFILGADSLYTFDEWKEPGRILAACTILVGTRNHTSDEKLDRVIRHLEEKYQGKIEKLESLNIDISSKMIRSWIDKGRSLAYYVPDQVIDYIQKNNIYKGCDEDEV